MTYVWLSACHSFWRSAKEKRMDTMLTFVGLFITTLVALFAALALQTLLLRVAFALMQPATASRRVPQPAVEHGTQLVARAFSRAR
jgi:hypothetical protein